MAGCKRRLFKNYTLRYTNTILDSLSDNKLSSYQAGLRHLYIIDSLRAEIKKGGEYEHTVAPNDTPNYNIIIFILLLRSGSIWSSLKIILEISSAA